MQRRVRPRRAVRSPSARLLMPHRLVALTLSRPAGVFDAICPPSSASDSSSYGVQWQCLPPPPWPPPVATTSVGAAGAVSCPYSADATF